jgi:hypothetical protein
VQTSVWGYIYVAFRAERVAARERTATGREKRVSPIKLKLLMRSETTFKNFLLY